MVPSSIRRLTALLCACVVGPITQAKTYDLTPVLGFQAARGTSSSTKAAKKTDNPGANKGAKPEEVPPTATASYDPLVYRIGIDDELQISVWREPELSAAVAVRPDGMITLPLINDVKAVGLRTEELQVLLAEKLKNFINEPQVTVIVRAIHSRKVSLVGNVSRQGSYTLSGGMTMLELLAAAGGLGTFAKSESIYILREQNGKKIKIPFHYKQAVSGKSEDVVLYPGDVVVVP